MENVSNSEHSLRSKDFIGEMMNVVDRRTE